MSTSDKSPRPQITGKPEPRQIGKAPDPRQIGKDADPRQLTERPDKPHTLVIDIGGTGIKMLVVDDAGAALNERARRLTPDDARPRNVLRVIQAMIPEQPPFDRISVGFPGVIRGGVVHTAANLHPTAWKGMDLQAALLDLTGRPARVVNDADLAGYGVVIGRGVEMVLTLGTGMGAALFSDGHLVPNLELGHHPFHKGETYEERIGDAVRKRIGKKRWRRRVHRVFEQVEVIFNPELTWVGGGNAKHLLPEDLGTHIRLFDSVQGMRGGARIWNLGKKPFFSEG